MCFMIWGSLLSIFKGSMSNDLVVLPGLCFVGYLDSIWDFIYRLHVENLGTYMESCTVYRFAQ